MGKYAIKTTQSATNSVLGTSIPYTDLAEKGYIPDIPTEKDKGYPTISVDGVPYHFDPTGTEATSYQIEWFRLVVANGANTGNNEYNPTVNYGINTYHLDGYIRLRETAAITVDFKVLPPNSTQFSIVGNQDGTEPFVQRIDFDSTDGVSESKVVRPNTANSNWDNSIEVDGVTYVFDGWYRDENFTERATWQATLKSNQTYYGRYVCSTHTLRITNTVTGNMGNQDYPFKYSLEFFDGDNKKTQNVLDNLPKEFEFSNGTYIFTLKHNQSTPKLVVPANLTYKVTQIDGTDYETSATNHRNGERYNPEDQSHTHDLSKDTVVDFTNTKQGVIPSGLSDSNSNLYSLILMSGIGLLLIGAVFALRRRANER